MKKNQKIAALSLFFILSFFLIKSIYVPWTFFRSLSFRMTFFDLGLISDFLSNTSKGHWFFVSDLGINHLSRHWTPSLFLLTPFYHFFESQFLTILLTNLICSLGIAYFLLFIFRDLQTRFQNTSITFTYSLLLFFILLFFSNKYINANFLAGHFEILSIPFSLVAFTLILQGKSFWLILVPLLFALGVRQDVGFFLFFQLFSFFLIPKRIFDISKKTKVHIIIFMFLSIVYLALAVKIFLPLMGSENHLRADEFWSEWGQTWGEVTWNVLTHPLKVMRKFFSAGFTNFNEAFFYLGLFNPIQWFCVQIPGLLFYLANTTDKNHLFWYNSAFLLPGIYLSTYIGVLILVSSRAVSLDNKNKRGLRIFKFCFLILSCALLWRMDRAVNSENYAVKSARNELYLYTQNMNFVQSKCSEQVNSYATDLTTFVFLPNNSTKYLLHNYKKSQLIILNLRAKQFLTEQENKDFINNLEAIKNDKNLRYLYGDSNYVFYENTLLFQCSKENLYGKNKTADFERF